MNLTIFDSVQPSPCAAFSIDPSSLYHALEQIKDGRKSKGKRYPLALILTLLLLGKLAGETTIHGVVEWVALRAEELKKQLDWPRRFPSNATYTRALAACDAEELARVVAQVLLKAHAKKKRREGRNSQTTSQVAVDGKTDAAERLGISTSISQPSMCSRGMSRRPAWCWRIGPCPTSAMKSVR